MHKDNFRHLRKDLEPAEVKDIVDAFNFHDAEFQGIEITEKKSLYGPPNSWVYWSQVYVQDAYDLN
jgi:hypothetical protein